eukprot:CAMPEP_0185847070 /NCGR_PEP_ID=MMETSP1354-20130828/2485_1 /TAXON_ID=708628 /ORGANISM="Erythrolobus madagascarensis, Strain CCMP3276" /LENGTH=555 /DNA_ID=CAMNT_0028547319 /DNA_START=168 /DNA_END=1835 /DNA_ORIENTATION=-
MATGMPRIFSSDSFRLERVGSIGSFAELERNPSIGSFTRMFDNSGTSAQVYGAMFNSAPTTQQTAASKSQGPTTPQQSPGRTGFLPSNPSFCFTLSAAPGLQNTSESGAQFLRKIGSSAALDAAAPAAILEGNPLARNWSSSSLPQQREWFENMLHANDQLRSSLVPSQSVVNMVSCFERAPSYLQFVNPEDVTQTNNTSTAGGDREAVGAGKPAGGVLSTAEISAPDAALNTTSSNAVPASNGLLWNESMQDLISSLSNKLRSTEQEAAALAAEDRRDVVSDEGEKQGSGPNSLSLIAVKPEKNGVYDPSSGGNSSPIGKGLQIRTPAKKQPRKRHQQALDRLRRQLEIVTSRASVIGQLTAVYAAEAQFLMSSGERLRRENEYFSLALQTAKSLGGAVTYRNESLSNSQTQDKGISTKNSSHVVVPGVLPAVRSGVPEAPIAPTPAPACSGPTVHSRTMMPGAFPLASPVPWGFHPAPLEGLGVHAFAPHHMGAVPRMVPPQAGATVGGYYPMVARPTSSSALTQAGSVGHELEATQPEAKSGVVAHGKTSTV